jgi:hypothetical protein
MIVGQSDVEYVLIRAAIIFFSYLGLLGLLYFYVVLSIGGVPAIAFPFSIIIEGIALLEILFYFCWFLPYKSYLQRPAAELPPPLTRGQRKELFLKGLEHVPDPELYVRKWMHNAHVDDLRQENVKEWLLWVLFDRDGPPGADDEELAEYISEIERRMNMKIKPGRSEVQAMRLNFDPVPITHRSLFFYLVGSTLTNVL